MSLQPYHVSTLPGKTKNSAKLPTPYCSVLCWTDCSNFRRKSFSICSVRFFSCLLENSFSSLLAENILHLHGFYQKSIFKLNMVNFIMWTKVKLVICDVSQLWAIKYVNYIWLWSVHSCFQWWKNGKNRPRNARVIVENKWFHFYGTLCTTITTQTALKTSIVLK